MLKFSFSMARMIQRKYKHDKVKNELKILMKNVGSVENAIYKQIQKNEEMLAEAKKNRKVKENQV